MDSKENLPAPKKPLLSSDHLANERTFLAWIRTSISLMGFGFVIVKFALFIQQISIVFGHVQAPVAKKGFSGIVGVSMVAVGAIIAVLAYLRYKRIENHLNNNEFYTSKILVILLTLFVLAGSILLVIYLLPNVL